MGLYHVRSYSARDFLETPRGSSHQAHFPDARKVGEPPWLPKRSIKTKPVDLFLGCTGNKVLGTRQLECIPAQSALLAQDRSGAKGVAALQWERVIENVEDAQGHPAAS